MRTWEGPESFATTRWTMVLQAGDLPNPDSERALAELCTSYWYPLYTFVRRRGYEREAARDLTQAFFVKVLEKNFVVAADRDRGKFRSFLLGALKHFLANEWDRDNALKRGGGKTHVAIDFVEGEETYGRELADTGTPEDSYARSWALVQVDRALEDLRQEMVRAGQEARFEKLGPFLTGEDRGMRYREVAAELGISEGAVKVGVHRMRLRFGELLRTQVGQTLDDPEDIDEELRGLFAALSTD